MFPGKMNVPNAPPLGQKAAFMLLVVQYIIHLNGFESNWHACWHRRELNYILSGSLV